MKTSGDVVILGGGVIGLTTAYYLARAGQRVVVCDQGLLGREASWAGAGILPPSDPVHARDPLDRLRALSGRLYPGLSEELRADTGIDNGYVRCGGLVFNDPLVHADDQEWCGAGIDTGWLEPRALRQLEPALAPDLGPAQHIAGMAQLRNPRHLRALETGCARTGRVVFREETPIARLCLDGDAVRGAQCGADVIAGSTFVIAAGAWTERLLAPLGIHTGITPVRGQMVLLNPGRMLFQHILACGPRYLVPRLDGRVLAGSTEEHAGFDKRNTAEGVQGLLELATRLVPELTDASLEKCWSGLRPGSPDGLPLIGQVPGVRNLYVAAGHFRAGLQLSPGTAWLMKEFILGEPLSLPLEAFAVERLGAVGQAQGTCP
jgi:glycine oxidase